MITVDKLQRAMEYLADTDKPCARARALQDGLNRQEKTIKSVAFLESKGTVAEREALAYTSTAFIDHTIKIENATIDYETIRNRRLTAELIVEVWRSENANRRQGNIA